MAELEAATKKVRDRCEGFLAGAKRYKEGVQRMQDASVAFAGSLKDFCGNVAEEDPLTLGACGAWELVTIRGWVGTGINNVVCPGRNLRP